MYPALFDSRGLVKEDIDEMRGQLRKQVERLRELRVKKFEEPGMPSSSMQSTKAHSEPF